MGIQMTWQQRSNHHRKGGCGPPLGLRNLGNTCYLNSVLQCLTYTPPLAQFCLSSQHSSLCKRVTANREKECPFCILERQIARSLSIDGPMDAPSKISKCVTLYAEHFRLGRQEDAHEFLRYVIDACHNTCLKLLTKINGKKDQGEKSMTVMKEIFGGTLLSQVKCLGCKGESNKIDEIMDISLDLFQSNSLKDALGKFFQPEILDGNNKYCCSNCKKLCVAKKQMFIQRAPNVLVIQLKRFEGIHGGKINRNVDFEEVLALTKYMCIGFKDPQPEYNLFGSIVHSGFSPESGHYYAYIKDAYGRWYCCNDTHVSLSSTQEVLSEKVYILFYIRNNQSPRTNKCGSLSKEVKYFESVETNTSACRRSDDPAKPPHLKANGHHSNENGGTITPKNCKIPLNPQIKPFSLSSSDPRRVLSNGNSDIGIHSSSLSERQEPRRVVSNGNVDIMGHNSCLSVRQDKQSHGGKENKIVPVKDNKESKGEVKVVQAPHPHGSAANGILTSCALENKIKERCMLETGERDCVNRRSAAVRVEADCIHTSSKDMSERNPGNAGSKRKACDSEMMESVEVSDQGSQSLYRFIQSPKVDGGSDRKHSKELEEFKKVLVEEASCGLRASGWVEDVLGFMTERKRLLCSQASGGVGNISELKKQLIDDARKSFTSQIPESLKGHLIGRLRSYSQDTLS